VVGINKSVSLLSEALDLVAVLLLDWNLWLEGLGVHEVEDSCEETSDGWTSEVAISVMSKISIGVFEPEELVENKTNTNSWVVAGAKSSTSLDHAHKSGNDSDGPSNTVSGWCGVSALHHQDHANKNEGADNLVDGDIDVKREVTIDLAIADGLLLQVLLWTEGWSPYKDLLAGLWIVKGEVGHTDGDKGSHKLCNNDFDHE